METLTEQQINTVAKLLENEIPFTVKSAFINDRSDTACRESVHAHLVRKIQRGSMPTVLGSMVMADKTGLPLLEFNKLDKYLTERFEKMVDEIKNDSFVPGIPIHKKMELVDFICDFSIPRLNEYVDLQPWELEEIAKKIKIILENKINDFEL
jgi:hypothetical protein